MRKGGLPPSPARTQSKASRCARCLQIHIQQGHCVSKRGPPPPLRSPVAQHLAPPVKTITRACMCATCAERQRCARWAARAHEPTSASAAGSFDASASSQATYEPSDTGVACDNIRAAGAKIIAVKARRRHLERIVGFCLSDRSVRADLAGNGHSGRNSTAKYPCLVSESRCLVLRAL